MQPSNSPRKRCDKLFEELEARYCRNPVLPQRLLYLRKKYAWLLLVSGTKAFKRSIDIGVSVAALCFLSPLMLLIAIAIKLYDGGPIFYISNRVGKWGREFRFPKFRSMVVGAASIKHELQEQTIHKKDITFKMRNDPRVTPLGRWLRRLSLDELPQLWPVLKGEMSLVGPRPPLPSEVAKYSLEERRRLEIPPGITCLWQVKGRSNLAFPEQVNLDIQYIESQSIWLDLRLLLQTVPAVILGTGAY